MFVSTKNVFTNMYLDVEIHISSTFEDMCDYECLYFMIDDVKYKPCDILKDCDINNTIYIYPLPNDDDAWLLYKFKYCDGSYDFINYNNIDITMKRECLDVIINDNNDDIIRGITWDDVDVMQYWVDNASNEQIILNILCSHSLSLMPECPKCYEYIYNNISSALQGSYDGEDVNLRVLSIIGHNVSSYDIYLLMFGSLRDKLHMYDIYLVYNGDIYGELLLSIIDVYRYPPYICKHARSKLIDYGETEWVLGWENRYKQRIKNNIFSNIEYKSYY
jgi:hypothetical protein